MTEARYTSVDDLQTQLTLSEAAAKCGTSLEIHGSGQQVRLDCPFGCPGDHAGKREISVDTGNPQKVFCCHAYGCQVRGNLLTLMHGWTTGTLPEGGRLKGMEFKRARDRLAATIAPSPATPPTATRVPSPQPTEPPRNCPLADSANEKARELVTLDEKFITDMAHMPPAAASYVRRHPCLSLAALQKWRVGVLPADGGGDKRAWSHRGQLLYPVLSEDGQLLAWVARDPQFEMKDQAFQQLAPAERINEKKPAKHRFPVDFHRGLELFGQQSARLKEPGYREKIARYGIIICEGFNDIICADACGFPAVAIMSNRITAGQVAKIERWANSLAGGKVTILFDADDAGDEGAKDAAWQFLQRGLNVRLGWSQAMYGGAFKGRQPEGLKRDEWEQLITPSNAGKVAVTE